MTEPVSDPPEQGWPRFSDFPQTEAGWNHYANQWLSRRRRTSGIGQIPLWAVEEYRAANALAARLNWQESEG
jgi:hypothetical protein